MSNEEIAYQNKDIVSKIFGENMKGKPLSLFGLNSNLKVVDIKPTNIPVVKANEFRMDNVFELEDGSIAILDYESTYRESNFIKYGYYILNIAERYLKEGKHPDIRMMVLYTADIDESPTLFQRTACGIKIEPASLVGVDSDAWMKEIKEGIEHQAITDELLMHLILLPLTYKGNDAKQPVIKECIDLAQQVKDKEKETFALAGILTLTDKVISEELRNQIKEVLSMTQIGRMLYNDGVQETKRDIVLRMLKKDYNYEEIAELNGVSVEQVKAWETQAKALEDQACATA